MGRPAAHSRRMGPEVASRGAMTKIDITKTELVWPGKYNEDSTLRETPRVNLPFQVIETFNESRATREARETATMTLFDFYEAEEGDTFDEGWKNKLIWGDNLVVMGSLLDKFAGRIDLIYIDPPFATGADFTFDAQIGETGPSLVKEQSAIEEKAYRDTWHEGTSSYLAMLYNRLVLMRDLLAKDGSIYVHCDSTVNYLLRSVMDEIFGKDNFRNEIVWCYKGPGNITGHFPRKHDTILFYAKGHETTFNKDAVRVPYSGATLNRRRYTEGKAGIAAGYSEGRSVAEVEAEFGSGKVPEDWWSDIGSGGHIPRKELVGYPTQKPLALLERIIKASSDEGDLVADFFCGSGTTLAAAENLRRRWIGCDLGRWSVHVTRKRLLDIDNCKPFELLNLGKYERQYWQGMAFGARTEGATSERSIYEYLAFILKLYGAAPIAGTTYLHGKKGNAMVHIGSVDAPVTIDEVNTALDECAKLKQDELHVLGWEWEMGLVGPNTDLRKGGLMHDVARRKGVRLLLLQIPREVMEEREADDGSVRFFELAYLKARVDEVDWLTVKVTLEDFVMPNTDLIPDDVRTKIEKWSDYIDYWAVDWDFQSDTFMQGWVTYRTRQDRALLLTSDSHTYKDPGRYMVLIKIVDIFGNDTSQAFSVQVG